MKLVLTCGACPEQYDAFDDHGARVGYLRLRHGYFAAYDASRGGEPLYAGYPDGDGIFMPDERDRYLTAAVKALGGDGSYTVEESPAW